MSPVRPRDRFGRPLPRGSEDELNRHEEPEQLPGAAEACRRGIASFNERRFFEAHEFFEHVWKAAEIEDRDRDYWKGVTQVAVGCCHAQRGNDRGALALLERAADYLRPFPTPHCGIDTQGLISAARSVAEQVRRRGAFPELDFPQFPLPRG
jgi:predicted metal-dependent hydrolase